jgi:hypothetical protein
MNYLKIIDELAGHHSTETDSPTRKVEPSSEHRPSNDVPPEMDAGASSTIVTDPTDAAYNILLTCQRYGVALRIDSDGTLIIGRAGATAEAATQPWPSLLIAIEAHAETVAMLVSAGWHLRAMFPQESH